MRARLSPALLVLLSLLVPSTRAAHAADDPLERIRRHVDERTLLVGRIELDATPRQARDILGPAAQDADLDSLITRLGNIAALADEAGADAVWILWSLAEIDTPRPVLVLPARSPDAAERLAVALADTAAAAAEDDDDDDEADDADERDADVTAPDDESLRPRVLGRDVVIAAAVDHARLAKRNPEDPTQDEILRHMAAAIEATSTPVILVIDPPSYAARVVETLLPTLPDSLGGEPVTTLTRGLDSTRLTLTAAPGSRLEIVVRARSTEAADRLEAFLDRLVPAVAALLPERIDGHDRDEILARIRPERDGIRLHAVVPGPMLGAVVGDVLVPAILEARARARLTVSLLRARTLVVGMFIHAQNHDDAFPDSLDELVRGDFVEPELLFGRDGERFVYRRPLVPFEQFESPGRVIVVHEPTEPWPANGLAAGFLDGHAEIIADRDRFDALIAEQGDLTAAP